MSRMSCLDFVVSLVEGASSPLSLACVRGWGEWNQLVCLSYSLPGGILSSTGGRLSFCIRMWLMEREVVLRCLPLLWKDVRKAPSSLNARNGRLLFRKYLLKYKCLCRILLG